MRNLVAKIENILSNGILNIVTFDFHQIKLKMLSLELSENVQIDKKVILNIKPTAVTISKDFVKNITCFNQIPVCIDSIETQPLLSSVDLKINDAILESIITTQSAEKLNLKKGDELVALIKESDISILKVLDD